MFPLNGFRGGSKEKVLKHFGYTATEKPRAGYTVYVKSGCAGTIDVVGHGAGAMWYHRAESPAQPNHSFGRTARELYAHLGTFGR